MINKPIISEKNTFANAVISKSLDDRARLWAAKLRTTRSKLISKALDNYIQNLEKESANDLQNQHN